VLIGISDDFHEIAIAGFRGAEKGEMLADGPSRQHLNFRHHRLRFGQQATPAPSMFQAALPLLSSYFCVVFVSEDPGDH